MPHMNIVLTQCLFLIIAIILYFGQIWFQNLEFSKQTVIWHRNILLYVTAIWMFLFSKCLPFKFGLKVLLQLSQKIATIVACRIFRFPKFIFWNSGTWITSTRIHSMYSTQTEVRSRKGDYQYTCHSFRLIMKSCILFQRNSVMVIDL